VKNGVIGVDLVWVPIAQLHAVARLGGIKLTKVSRYAKGDDYRCPEEVTRAV
jgi:hypothetical protein